MRLNGKFFVFPRFLTLNTLGYTTATRARKLVRFYGQACLRQKRCTQQKLAHDQRHLILFINSYLLLTKVYYLSASGFDTLRKLPISITLSFQLTAPLRKRIAPTLCL